MNAVDAKKIADEFLIEQESLMNDYVKEGVALACTKINVAAQKGAYQIEITSDLFRQAPHNKIPFFKEDEVLKKVAKSLEDDYRYSTYVNKSAPQLTYCVNWN